MPTLAQANIHGSTKPATMNHGIIPEGGNVELSRIYSAEYSDTRDVFALEDNSYSLDSSDFEEDNFSFVDSQFGPEEVQSKAFSNYNRILYGKPNELYKYETWYCGYYCGDKGEIVRKYLRKTQESSWFKYCILSMIFANTIILSLWNPVAAEYGLTDPRNTAVYRSEWVFLTLFTIEALLKMIAFGLIWGKHSYFRSAWNIFDFIIVVTGLTAVALDLVGAEKQSSNLSAFRAFRILRAFKEVRASPRLNIMIEALMHSITQIFHVGLLIMSTFVIFGIIGTVLFRGKFRQRCVVDFGETLNSSHVSSLVVPTSEEGRFCSFNVQFGRQCPNHLICATLPENPELVSFDNFPASCLTIFQILTLEGWSDIMYAVMDTSHPASQLYFIILIIVGSFFLLNLLVVVLSTNYTKYRERIELGLHHDDSKPFDKVTELAEKRKREEEEKRKMELKKAIKKTEMRLLYSWECRHDEPGYNIITKKEYLRLKQIHFNEYEAWKKETIPKIHKRIRESRLKLMKHNEGIQSMMSIGSFDTYGDENKLGLDCASTGTLEETNKGAEDLEELDGVGESRNESTTNAENDEIDIVIVPDLEHGISSKSKRSGSHTSVETLISTDAIDELSDGVCGSNEENNNADTMEENNRPVQPNFATNEVEMHQNVNNVEENGNKDLFTKEEYEFKHMDSERREEINNLENDKAELIRQTSELMNRAKALSTRNQDVKSALDNLRSVLAQYELTEEAECDGHVETDVETYDLSHGENSRRNNGFRRRVKSLSQRPMSFIEGMKKAEKKLLSFESGVKGLPRGMTTDSEICRFCYNLVEDVNFQRMISLLIIFNVVVLSIDHFNQPQALADFIFYSNTVLTVIFMGELMLKIYGYGPTYFFQIPMNTFDCFIILPSLFELIFSQTVTISAFRVFRLFQIFQLPRVRKLYSTFAKLLRLVGSTIFNVLPFAFVLMAFTIMFTVVGLHLFGGKQTIEHNLTIVGDDGDLQVIHNPAFDCTPEYGDFYLNATFVHCPPRANFDTFLWSLVTTFQVLTLENWNSIMFELVAQMETRFFPLLYFLLLICIGTFVILQLFLAILIDNFNLSHSDRYKLKLRAIKEDLSYSINSENIENGKEDAENKITAESLQSIMERSGNDLLDIEQREEMENNEVGDNTGDPHDNDLAKSSASSNKRLRRHKSSILRSGRSSRRSNKRRKDGNKEMLRQLSLKLSLRRNEMESRFNHETHEAFNYNSLHVLKPDNKYRVWISYFITDRRVEGIILLVIFLSCILLAMDNPLSRNERKDDAIYICELFVTIVFSVEAILKIIAFGFVRNPGSYLRDPWNAVDFVVTCVSVLNLILPDSAHLTVVKILRSFRALRPLRVIRQFESLRIVVSTLVHAFVPCFQVGFLCFICFYVIGIVCVATFGGKLHSCFHCPSSRESSSVDVNGTLPNFCWRIVPAQPNCFEYSRYPFRYPNETCPVQNQCIGESIDGSVYYKWSNPTFGSLVFLSPSSSVYHFDNLLRSILTLYEISTLESWQEVMYATTDITGIGLEPVRGANDYMSLFWLTFIFITNFFLLQIFVAVIVDTFLLTSDKEKGNAFMSPRQAAWVDARQRASLAKFKVRPRRPKNKFRSMCYSIAESYVFYNFITFVIGTNTILMTTEHYDQSEKWTFALLIADYVFATIYACEAIIKISAYTFSVYIRSPQNQFDSFIVVTSIADILLVTSVKESADFLQVFEVLRVLRVFRLMDRIKGILLIRNTLIASLPSIMNILILLFIVLFVFAVLGMELFGYAILHSSTDFTQINEYANFVTFSRSLLTLFRMATGEQWNGIMHDLETVSKHAVWFCSLYTLTVHFLMINLFVAVILSNFLYAFGNDTKQIDEDSINDYAKTWSSLSHEFEDEVTLNLYQTLQGPCGAGASVAGEEVDRHDPWFKRKEKMVHEMAKKLRNPKYLPFSYFPKLVERLKQPLGLAGLKVDSFTPGEIMKMVSSVKVPVTKTGFIQYEQTLSALIDHALGGDRIPAEIQRLLEYRLPEKMVKNEQKLKNESAGHGVADEFAARKLQSVVRAYLSVLHLKRLRAQGFSEEEILKLMASEHERNLASKVFTSWTQNVHV